MTPIGSECSERRDRMYAATVQAPRAGAITPDRLGIWLLKEKRQWNGFVTERHRRQDIAARSERSRSVREDLAVGLTAPWEGP